MRRPLRLQILLPMAALMLGALVGVSVLNAYLSARNTKAQIHNQLRDVARTLSEASFPLTDAVLRQTRGLSGAEFVVVDETGQSVSASRTGLPSPARPRGPQPSSGEDLTLDEIVQGENGRYFLAAVDLPRQSNINGPATLLIFYPEEHYRTAVWNAAVPPLIVGTAALVFVAVLATLIAARVTHPLGRLRSQVEHIAHGDFQAIQLPERDDEIRELGRSINLMAEMLARYELEVRRNERLETLGQISGSMAHQLRNAVTGCRMALDLHRRECAAENRDETLTVAVRQLELMERYLRHFLSRENGPTAPHATVDLVSIVEDVLTVVRPNAEHVGVRVQFVPPPQPVQVQGNADSLAQLAINLVLNGIDAAATPASARDQFDNVGYVTVRIASPAENRIVFEVQDSGPGPGDEIRDAMFEPLVTGKIDGTGLGLSVAQEIAKQHHSEIRWEQRDGKTCFAIELPAAIRESDCVEVTRR